MDLVKWMERERVNTLWLAKAAGVTWKTARDARRGALLNARVARQIAAVCGLRRGRWVVDPASMLDLAPPVDQHEAAE